MALTDRAIKNAKPEAKPYKISDGEGLYLLVQPSGSKLWRLKYRFAGKENVLSIGKYPLVALIEARDRRYEAKKLLLSDVDPNVSKKEKKLSTLLNSNNTFRAVAQDWHNTNKKKWTPEHAERLWRRLELHALNSIGSRPVASIRTAELVLLIRRLEKKEKPDTAIRLAHSLHVVFRYAVHTGVIEHNPALDLSGIVAPYEHTHFATVPITELPELLGKLKEVSTSTQNRIALKLLMHTFVRPSELRFGMWAEIDWEKRQWRIPSERMKMKRPHVVPLSDSATEMLRELHALTGHGIFLFPSHHRRRHPVMSENTINKILKNMGYGGKQVGHGFRAMASTVLNESALFRPDVIEAQLSHIEENNSRKPYNRAEYLEERTDMMKWWSNYLEAAANTSTNKSGKTT